MFMVEQATLDSTLHEMAQDGHDLIGTIMVLSAVVESRKTLEQQYSPQTQALTIERLLDMLEEHSRELLSLSRIVRRQLKSVGDNLQ